METKSSQNRLKFLNKDRKKPEDSIPFYNMFGVVVPKGGFEVHKTLNKDNDGMTMKLNSEKLSVNLPLDMAVILNKCKKFEVPKEE